MRKINNCLNNSLKDICKKSIEIEKINQLVKQFLPDNLKEHCHVGSFYQGCLQLITQDAVWASQLRFYQTTLRDRLRSEGGVYHLTSIKINIYEPSSITSSNQKASPEKLKLPEHAKDLLRTFAESCQHEALKKALMKFSN